MKSYTFFIFTILAIFASCSSDDDKEEITYTLKTDKTSLLFTNQVNEEVLTFKIESNDSWTIDVEENDWITLDKTGGKGNAEVKATAKPNYGRNETIKLTIKGVNNKNNAVQISVNQTTEEEINILDSIPDAEFKKYLIENIFDNKTVVTRKEAKNIEIIKIYGLNIKSFEGIKFFTELRIFDCGSPKISSLDMSKNPKLKMLYCQNTPLEYSTKTVKIKKISV